jgi:hypothetical protein
MTKRLMMISFISLQNLGFPSALSNGRDPVRFELVNNQRTSHLIFKLVIADLVKSKIRHGYFPPLNSQAGGGRPSWGIFGIVVEWIVTDSRCRPFSRPATELRKWFEIKGCC